MATRFCWLGHATLLFESDGKHVLIDPFLTDNPAASMKADEVPADFILITHGHFDHIADAVPVAKRTGATVVANYEIAGWLQGKGLTKVHGMQHGGGHDFEFGRAKMTLAFHGSALPDGSYGGNPAGFHITFRDGLKVYNAADTALFSDMKLIGEEGVDFAILPIGDNFTMGPDDAVRAVKFLQPKKVFPFHYNTWELIAQDAGAWAEKVRSDTQAEPVVETAGKWIDLN